MPVSHSVLWRDGSGDVTPFDVLCEAVSSVFRALLQFLHALDVIIMSGGMLVVVRAGNIFVLVFC